MDQWGKSVEEQYSISIQKRIEQYDSGNNKNYIEQ